MNLCLSMVLLRPSSFVILLAYAALIVLLSLPPCWYVMFTRLEQHVNLNSENVLSQFHSEIENLNRLIQPMNSSSTNLARFLSSTLKATNISFSDIETKVAPLLFQAFKTVPNLAQISYIGMEGFSFSFYTDHDDQALAMYSNSSSSSTSTWGASNAIQYYIQHVNRDTGELYGNAKICERSTNASWIGKAVNSSNGYVTLGTKWSNGHDLLFISSSRITTLGVISIGFPAKAITDLFTIIGQRGAILYLATKEGQVLVEGLQHTRMVVSNDTVSFQSMNSANGDQTAYEGAVSCKDGVVASNLNIQGVEYLMHCSSLNIMGIDSVYVLAVPQNGLVSFVNKFKKRGFGILIGMMIMIFMASVSFVFTIARAARRETKKSHAFAIASHDIRASLAGLSGLIELSFEKVVPGSELETNLKQMDSQTKDLLGILNSILDTSKIEAGKMQLEEEEFNVFQLLEEVVHSNNIEAMKKGVDIVLDPCDGSILRYSRTKGDRIKLKRVLCNLLSNAVKFTDEGHITVRARAQKPSLQKNSIIATIPSYNFKRHWSRLLNRKNEAHGDIEAVNSIQQVPTRMNFIFEVDDTGKGIPKDKYKSVFENYVQAKETALGRGGTGLGLGTVRSLVRLMHGDVEIVEKNIGAKGTCFRFNVLFTVCEIRPDDITREGESGPGDRNQSHVPTVDTTSPRPEPFPHCSFSSSKRESGSKVSPTDERAIPSVELQKCGSSRSRGWKETQQSFGDRSCDRSKARASPVHQEGTKACGESSNSKPLSGKKILVVEDVEMLRRIALITLERLDASVDKCENGEQAVQLVEEGLTRDFPNPPYDYILMDCQMPVMNGSEATRRIREIEKLHSVRIPIIALTANTGEEAKMALEAGMDDYLVKPIKKELLLEAIRNIHSRE